MEYVCVAPSLWILQAFDYIVFSLEIFQNIRNNHILDRQLLEFMCAVCVWYCLQMEKQKRDCSKSPKSISSWRAANITQPFNIKCHENWAICPQLIRMSCIFLKLSTTLYRTLEHLLWQWTCTYWHEKCH